MRHVDGFGASREDERNGRKAKEHPTFVVAALIEEISSEDEGQQAGSADERHVLRESRDPASIVVTNNNAPRGTVLSGPARGDFRCP